MPLVNGKRKNQISIYDRGFMYGDSVFETILVKDYKPQYLNEHLSRLSKGCKFLEININKYNYLERDIKKIIKNKKNCILNIIVTRGNAKKGAMVTIKMNLLQILSCKHLKYLLIF